MCFTLGLGVDRCAAIPGFLCAVGSYYYILSLDSRGSVIACLSLSNSCSGMKVDRQRLNEGNLHWWSFAQFLLGIILHQFRLTCPSLDVCIICDILLHFSVASYSGVTVSSVHVLILTVIQFSMCG